MARRAAYSTGAHIRRIEFGIGCRRRRRARLLFAWHGYGRVGARSGGLQQYRRPQTDEGSDQRRRVVPACRSLDCVSVFAASCADAVRIAAVAEGFDAEDPYSRAGEKVALPLERFRFGVLKPEDREFFGDLEADALYGAAIERLSAQGGVPVELDYAPFREAAALLYDGPFVAERLAAIEDFFRANAAAMDRHVRAIIGKGLTLSAADAFKGEYRLREIARAAAGNGSGSI